MVTSSPIVAFAAGSSIDRDRRHVLQFDRSPYADFDSRPPRTTTFIQGNDPLLGADRHIANHPAALASDIGRGMERWAAGQR
jgi:hypothetical protein